MARQIDIYRERYTHNTYYLEASCGNNGLRTGLNLNLCLGFDGSKLVAQDK